MLNRPKKQSLPDLSKDVLIYEDGDYMLFVKDFINIGSIMASMAILDAGIKALMKENPKQYFFKEKEYKAIITSMIERLKSML